jgi:PAS domain S-box-containing protein
MTIRRRYHLSLLMVLALFGANLFAYFWSARIRSAAENEWDRATACELKISSIRQEMDNLNKEVALASQIQQEEKNSLLGDETSAFEKRARTEQTEIENLKASAFPDQVPAIETLLENYKQLSAAWMGFYQNAGKNESSSVRNLIDADKLAQTVFGDLLPGLHSLEAARVRRSQLKFRNAELLANRVIIATFILSVLIAFALSSLLTRYINYGFSTLKQGAHLIGDMELEHRIKYPARDEFAELAQSFNEMAEKLSSARHELLNTNQQLSESETRYRNMVERAVYGIYRCGTDGRFLHANPALVKMLGYSNDQDLINLKDVSDFYSDPADHAALLTNLRQSGSVEGFEVHWKTRLGEDIITRLSGNVVMNDGAITEFEMIAENVTQQRALQDQLRQAQKMEAVGRLAGGIAHDFNNLLTVIKGHSELLHSELRAEQARKEVEGVIRAADRAASLTRQLLAFSRRQLLTFKILDLNTIVMNMERLLTRLLGEDIHLTTSLEPGLGLIKADPNQIEQIIMNLAVNARDAMPTGGKLRIATSKLNLKHEVNQGEILLKPGSYTMLNVQDTGQGMDSVTTSRAFEPFFTTKEQGKGTGLGLSTVYGIVKQSDGEIWVESDPGKGASFFICFPQAADKQEPVTDAKLIEQAAGKETILIVEDEDDVRDVACMMLQRRGYQVLTASNSKEAEKICRSYTDTIHLLLTDVVLKETGGPELAATLTTIRPEMRVVYMSGYTDDVVLQHGIRNSQVAFLPKPFTTDELTSKVREVLDRMAAFSRHMSEKMPS